MVNLPPDSDERRRRDRGLDFDELLAVILALIGIGAILWWGLGRDRSLLTRTGLLAPEATATAIQGQTGRDEPRGLFEPRTLEEVTPQTGTSPTAPNQDIGLPGLAAPSQVVRPTPVVPSPVIPAPTPATQPLDISDVPTDHWAYPFIKAMYDQGLLPDFPSGQFQPDQVLTRAELAALLNRAFGDRPLERQPLGFTDVPDTYWAANAIDQVVAQGFMSGYPEGTFEPDRSVPRYEVLVAIVTGLKWPPSTTADSTLTAFVDANTLPAWSRSKVATAAAQGVVVNYPNRDQLKPNQAATRAEIVAFLHQALVNQGRLPAVESPYAVPNF